jgi:hypothetical protein
LGKHICCLKTDKYIISIWTTNVTRRDRWIIFDASRFYDCFGHIFEFHCNNLRFGNKYSYWRLELNRKYNLVPDIRLPVITLVINVSSIFREIQDKRTLLFIYYFGQTILNLIC